LTTATTADAMDSAAVVAVAVISVFELSLAAVEVTAAVAPLAATMLLLWWLMKQLLNSCFNGSYGGCSEKRNRVISRGITT
jgi:hypothetical protein